MEDYKINDYGVCVNPKIVAEYADGYCRYAVKVAFIAGAWRTGIDVNVAYNGLGCPCSASGNGCKYEREAINTGLEEVRDYMQNCIDEVQRYGLHLSNGERTAGKNETAILRKAIADIKKKITENNQLTLFDL